MGARRYPLESSPSPVNVLPIIMTLSRLALVAALLSPCFCLAQFQATIQRWSESSRLAPFQFPQDAVPAPSAKDGATQAEWSLLDGRIDPNSGGLAALHDDRLPSDPDQPGANFFLVPNSDGGRLLADLGKVKEVLSLNSYSWHPAERGPQVYTLYASDGSSDGFKPGPKRPLDPTTCGWRKLARVDTRDAEDPQGGLYGASVANSGKPLGRFRYLLLDVERTGMHPAFDQTFFSELDIITTDDEIQAIAVQEPVLFTVEAGEGTFEIAFDLTAAPDLDAWVRKSLAPVVIEWYPKLVAMLPSDGFTAPDRVTIRFRNGMGGTPASASGNRINCNAAWFRRNLEGEARGSVVHEMVHVVQQYGRARRGNPNATRTPGWLVEGIPDYIRWFLYEPETKGAEITRRNLDRARYDASYRVTGNFLNWVTTTWDPDLVRKLNAAAREGRYSETLWMDYTGKSLEDLGREWRETHEKRLAGNP